MFEDEGRDLDVVELAGLAIQFQAVGGHEGVGGVAADLGTFLMGDRIFDRELVQRQFLAECGEQFAVRDCRSAHTRQSSWQT